MKFQRFWLFSISEFRVACNSDYGLGSRSRVTRVSVILSGVRRRATHEVGKIYPERFVRFGRAEMNRFALIPPLRALVGRSGRDDKTGCRAKN